eukprot:TRINITY_DN2370_c0_g1_i1.p1 TRINITY_DN2370_c0_g1~~TRINITY_DN2370_c0_g1_i1.p1  ORF type:complete len:148 (+),score=21.95 TRINITY_DN2370_c0_g1_i1:606-1049(+)
MDCGEFQEACDHPDLFVCDPGAVLDGKYSKCKADPRECPGSNCFLGFLSVDYYHLDFHPYAHDYTVFVEPRAEYVQIYAAAMDYESRVTVGDTQYKGAIGVTVPLSYETYTDIEVSVCSTKNSTCYYRITIARGQTWKRMKLKAAKK